MRRYSVVFILSCLALAGCQKSLTAQDIAGNWTGKSEISDADLLNQIKSFGGTEKDLPEAKKKIASETVPLELKKDMTFSLGKDAGRGDGTWTFEKSTVVLTVTTAGGQPVADLIKKSPEVADMLKPISLTLSKDAKELTGTFPSPLGAKFTIRFAKDGVKS